METKTVGIGYESTQLISILSRNPAGKMNLARIKFSGIFICVLCKIAIIFYE